MDLSVSAFEALAIAELDALPDELLDRLENVTFVIEDVSSLGLDVLGIYDGAPLTERDQYGFGELPDRIVLYRAALLDRCGTEEELRREIRITLIHEIGHYFGFDDDDLHDMGWS